MVRKIKAAANSKNVIKAAQDIKSRMSDIQESLKNKILEASVGGGAVKVKVNGKKEILDITIAKELVDPNELDTLQELVLAGVNEALRQADAYAEEQMAGVTGNFHLPGLF